MCSFECASKWSRQFSYEDSKLRPLWRPAENRDAKAGKVLASVMESDLPAANTQAFDSSLAWPESGCNPNCFSFSRKVKRDSPSHRAALAWLPSARAIA